MVWVNIFTVLKVSLSMTVINNNKNRHNSRKSLKKTAKERFFKERMFGKNAAVEVLMPPEEVTDADPERKTKVKTLKRAAQNFKITAIKTEKLVEKVRKDIMARLEADIASGKEGLEELSM